MCQKEPLVLNPVRVFQDDYLTPAIKNYNNLKKQADRKFIKVQKCLDNTNKKTKRMLNSIEHNHKDNMYKEFQGLTSYTSNAVNEASLTAFNKKEELKSLVHIPKYRDQ